MSAFSPQPNNSRTANKLEFVTQREVANFLSVDPRTVRRYLRDPQIREILGAVYDGKRWRVPRSSFESPWRVAVIKERLTSIGRGGDSSVSSRFRRESGIGNLRLEREAKILRQAMEIERLHKRARLTKRVRYGIDEVWKRTRTIASRYRCSIFAAPKFWERFLIAQNDREKKRNASAIKWLKGYGLWNSACPRYSEWLKRQGLWALAKELINSGEDYSRYQDGNGEMRRLFFQKGWGYFKAVIGYQGEDKRTHNFLIPNSFTEEGKDVTGEIAERRSIHLSPVKTKAQIAREVRQFLKWWPSQKSIEVATVTYDKNFWQLDLERAARECRRQKKEVNPENLRKYMCRDDVAQWQGRGGISRSSYYRRGYTETDLARVRRSRMMPDTQHLPNQKLGATGDGSVLDRDDLKNMTILTASGSELPNFYHDHWKNGKA
jgi:hypothetical protein